MNIAGSREADGLLLAASLLIQQDRSVGDVSKLISDIAADLEPDGTLSADLNEEIHRYEQQIYDDDVIGDLLDFYEKNKVTGYAIPPFYKYLSRERYGALGGGDGYFFDSVGGDDDAWTYDPGGPNIGYDANGFTRTDRFLSTIPFNVKSDADWLSVEKRMLCETIYEVTIVAQPNTGENRTGHVVYTDNSGRELDTYTYQQKAPDALVPQRLFFAYNRYGQELGDLNIERIDVNGKAYGVSSLPYGAQYGYGYSRYVDIPYTDKQERYQVYFPVGMVSMPWGYGTYTVSLPASFTTDDVPFIAQIDHDQRNPAFVEMRLACPCIMLDARIYPNLDRMVVTSDGFPLRVNVSYRLYDGNPDTSYPIYDEGATYGKDAYTLNVKYIPHENQAYILIPVSLPETDVKVQFYDKADNLIDEGQFYVWAGNTR